MSKDPASRVDPSSRAVSPRAAPSSSPTTLQSNLRSGVLEPPTRRESPESARIAGTNGDLTQPNPRAIGVHTILNPTESQSNFSSSTAAQRPAGDGRDPLTTANQYGSSPTTQRPYSYPGQGSLRGHQASPTPPVGSPASGFSSSDHTSPTVMHPHPAVGTARRYLTPRSPRASSSSQGHIRQSSSSHHASYLPSAPSGISRVYHPESGTPGPPQSPRSSHPLPLAPYYGGMGPRGTPTSTGPPTRPSSQPASTPFAAPGHISPSPQGTPPPHCRPQGYPTPYSTAPPSSSLGYPHSLPPNVPRRSGGFGGMPHTGFAIADGQPILAINPEGGERMLIPVNTDHASKAADEKRQRNAGASARFRQRKKDKDEAKDMALRRLEGQHRELERRYRDLEADLERIRNDRNRLRDIVVQTHGSDIAYQGPPSPVPRRSSGGGYLERSPLAPVAPPAPVAGFTHPNEDPHAGERAARRRRTDPTLGYSMPAYVTTPGALPPAPSPTYSSSLSQPGTPSSTHPPSTLPPLRLEPASTSGPGSASGHQPNYSYRREYESGWATRPSETRDR